MRSLFVIACMLLPTAIAGDPLADSDKCSAEDNTGGFGGQEVACALRCEADDVLSVSVDAVDEDAEVSGTVKCGGLSVHCSGDETCEAEDGFTDVAAAGTCTASSNEALDSGLYVECASQEGVGPPDSDKFCIPGVICVPESDTEPDLEPDAPAPGAPRCSKTTSLDRPDLADCAAISSGMTARMWLVAGEMVGEVCRADDCEVVVPACSVEDGRRTCSIGL